MDSRQLFSLANDCIAVLGEAGATKAEAIMTLAMAHAKVMQDGVSAPAGSDKQEDARDPVPPVVNKSVPYDPFYDPPPPFDIDKPPARDDVSRQKLADAQTGCICQTCKKVVYITNAPIFGGMKVEEFRKAFTPTPGMKELPKTAEIQNIDGNIATDCPACSGLKTLYLTGGPKV